MAGAAAFEGAAPVAACRDEFPSALVSCAFARLSHPPPVPPRTKIHAHPCRLLAALKVHGDYIRSLTEGNCGTALSVGGNGSPERTHRTVEFTKSESSRSEARSLPINEYVGQCFTRHILFLVICMHDATGLHCIENASKIPLNGAGFADVELMSTYVACR